MALATWRAISCCPVRLCPPMPATARSSSSITNCSPAVCAASPAATSVIDDELFQFGREALPHHYRSPGTGLDVVKAKDLGVGLMKLADQVPALVRDEQLHLDRRPGNGVADGLQQFRDALPSPGRNHDVPRLALLQPLHHKGVRRIGLVQDDDLRHLARVDFAEDLPD